MLPLLVAAALSAAALGIALGAVAGAASAAWAHLAFALGAMPLIFGAIAHFVPVLTRSGAPPPSVRRVPLAAFVAGMLVVLAFAGVQPSPIAVSVAAVAGLAAATTMFLWIVARGRATLGAPHPGLRWYGAACGFLAAGLLAALAMALWPQQYGALRLLHLHLNILGFVGLTAIGTLQVLLPTAAGGADPGAARRLARDLGPAAGGAALVAVGAAWFKPLGYLGLILYLLPLIHLGRVWWSDFRPQILDRDGAAPSLARAAAGLIGLLAAGAAHGLGWLAGRDAIVAFIAAFLLPLISGAATQLLPVWLRPGTQTDWHHSLRQNLGRWGAARADLMVAGGLLMALGVPEGAVLTGAGFALLVTTIALAGARMIDIGKSR